MNIIRLKICLGIILGGGIISGVIVFDLADSLYNLITPHIVQSQVDNNIGAERSGLPNSIFLPEIPFGGKANVCICDCSITKIARVNVGPPSKFRWPGTNTTFMMMENTGYLPIEPRPEGASATYKHIKDYRQPPNDGSQLVGKAYDVPEGIEPVCITRTPDGCEPCGKGDPILYFGESQGSVQPTGSTEENPWVPPY